MANEVIQAFLTVASAISSIVSIVAAIRNRHDKALRAMTWGLVGVSSFGLTTYCFVSLTRGWLAHVRSVAQEQATHALREQHDKSTAGLIAEIKRKDQRIAHLEAQLPGSSRSTSDGAAQLTPVNRPTATASCPLNDTWECAKGLSVGQKDSDEFRANDRERYYYIDIATPRAFTVIMDPVPESPWASVSVHDADRRELKEQGFAAPGSFDTRVRAAGRYYLKVKLQYCCVRAPQPYTITLSS
jgi:hypothetical protein